LDVTDVFDANVELLREIFAKYFTQIKKCMDLEDAQQFSQKDCNLGIAEKDV